jgi:hypothetical protein
MIMKAIKRHIRNFNGSHYRERIKAYQVLEDASVGGSSEGLTCVQICNKANLNMNYIRSRIGTWVRWADVAKKPGINEDGRPCFYYQIAKSGIKFLRSIPDNIIKECRERMNNEENT